MEYKKIIILFLGMFLFLNLVSASGYQLSTMPYNQPHQEMVRERFENNYQFECPGTCEFSEDGNQTRLEVRTQTKLFGFINIEYNDAYELDDEGTIVKAQHSFWSRILNRNKLQW